MNMVEDHVVVKTKFNNIMIDRAKIKTKYPIWRINQIAVIFVIKVHIGQENKSCK